MPELVYLFALASICLLVLVKSSEMFVEYAARLARRLGLSPLIIGLTVVAVGTSLPEIAASVTAALNNSGDLAMANVLGSNAANIGIIFGLITLFYGLKIQRKVLLRDALTMVFATVLLGVMLRDFTLDKFEGAVLLIFFVAYILFLARKKPKWAEQTDFKGFLLYAFQLKFLSDASGYVLKLADNKMQKSMIKKHILIDAAAIIVFLALILFSSKYAVDYGVRLADVLNISHGILGLKLVSIGTSLPELSVSLVAARKGLFEIVVGNVLGSNVTNIFLVAGLSAIAGPPVIPPRSE